MLKNTLMIALLCHTIFKCCMKMLNYRLNEKIRDFSTKNYFRKLKNYINMLVDIKKRRFLKGKRQFYLKNLYDEIAAKYVPKHFR